ncbi:hypothetical protein EI71_00371 [Anaeroplasma bactoclasticum]|jgi:hypothetical protein|uniref:DUF4422 domain-containing protein n=1 Tax=Anaeroplasma bactoclasticum TaxID=2088 RepID=A0A397S146_9MOLU|nr:DUF4422 domain-containing protein [Anaeroplasma bactoclasticum]RIA78419.1 hypothetical protein EI71_00371 [Anaeroplasma bactoclasticum]
MNDKLKIYVSTHKKYNFPVDDIYIPVQVGIDEGAPVLGYQGDNTGDNISFKHKYYSDLSTMYWVWKNSNVEYAGVCHYRRYFVSKKNKNRGNKKLNKILNEKEILDLLKDNDILIPKKRNYFIETIESHFKHTHGNDDYDVLRQILKEKNQKAYDAFNIVSKCRSAHIFNCFIMKKEYFNSYCSFIFPILFELEKRVDISNRTEYEMRFCGYLAEFLLDTWLIINNYPYKEIKLKVIEGEKKLKKIIAFLKAKFFSIKYDKSF